MNKKTLTVTFTSYGAIISVTPPGSSITIFSHNIYRIAHTIRILTDTDKRSAHKYAKMIFKWWKAKAFRTPYTITIRI